MKTKMKKPTRRQLYSIVLSILVVAAFLPMVTTQVSAAVKTAKDYSSEKAITYAQNHWNDGGKDCVVFVRACLEAGGIPREVGRNYGYTPQQYMNYLLNNNYAVKFELKTSNYYRDFYGININDNAGKIAKGDVILYHCNNSRCTKKDFHVSISNGTGHSQYTNYVTCYAQNTAVNNGMACKIRHSRCGASKNTITMYVLHIKSAENGYSVLDIKLAKPVVKATSARKAVKLTWEAVEDASGYKVYRATTKTGKYSLIKTVKNGKTLSYTNSKLKSSKRYYYKVKAYNNDGLTVITSSYSTLKSAKTK